MIFNYNLYTKEQQVLIKEYKLERLFTNQTINENFIEDIFGKPEFSNKNFVKISRACLNLISIIIKKSGKEGKELISKMISKTKEIRKNKDSVETLKTMFYFLIFMSLGLYTNSLKDEYNKKPVIENTKIVQNENGEYSIQDTLTNKEIANKAFIFGEYGLNVTNETSPIMLRTKLMVQEPNYAPSEYILNALKDVEKFSDHAYETKPHNGDWTIGYGHKIQTRKELDYWKQHGITKEAAEQLFRKDSERETKEALRILKTLPYYNKVVFSEGFIDGLISIKYNTSTNFILDSPFWKKLKILGEHIDKKNKCVNLKDFNFTVKDVKDLYNKDTRPDDEYGGLITRRAAEARIMSQKIGDINPKLYNLKK